VRADVEAKIKAVRDALAANDIQRVRSTTYELESALQRVGQEVYGQGQAGAAAGEQGPSSGSDPNTVEGEYREV
jgi:hypothetical protein